MLKGNDSLLVSCVRTFNDIVLFSGYAVAIVTVDGAYSWWCAGSRFPGHTVKAAFYLLLRMG
jgi:hypothetical protein